MCATHKMRLKNEYSQREITKSDKTPFSTIINPSDEQFRNHYCDYLFYLRSTLLSINQLAKCCLYIRSCLLRKWQGNRNSSPSIKHRWKCKHHFDVTTHNLFFVRVRSAKYTYIFSPCCTHSQQCVSKGKIAFRRANIFPLWHLTDLNVIDACILERVEFKMRRKTNK